VNRGRQNLPKSGSPKELLKGKRPHRQKTEAKKVQEYFKGEHCPPLVLVSETQPVHPLRHQQRSMKSAAKADGPTDRNLESFWVLQGRVTNTLLNRTGARLNPGAGSFVDFEDPQASGRSGQGGEMARGFMTGIYAARHVRPREEKCCGGRSPTLKGCEEGRKNSKV